MQIVRKADVRNTRVGARGFRFVAGMALAILLSCLAAPAHAEEPAGCAGGKLNPQGPRMGGNLTDGDSQPDLVISVPCEVEAGKTYKFGNVNIIKGGTLTFKEGPASATTRQAGHELLGEIDHYRVRAAQ